MNIRDEVRKMKAVAPYAAATDVSVRNAVLAKIGETLKNNAEAKIGRAHV